jgi:hypothetical protein
VVRLEAGPHSNQAPTYACTDGVDRQVQPDGNHTRGQVLEVPKHKGCPVRLGKAFYRPDEASFDLEPVDDLLLRRDPFGARDALLTTPIDPSLAEQVPGLVSYDTREPGCEWAPSPPAIPQRSEPRLLHDILDEVVSVQRGTGDRTHERSVLQEVLGVERRTC